MCLILYFENSWLCLRLKPLVELKLRISNTLGNFVYLVESTKKCQRNYYC